MKRGDIGLRVGNYIKERGFNQAEIARRSEMSTSGFNLFCNGKMEINCVAYYKVCKALDVSLDFFFEGFADG